MGCQLWLFPEKIINLFPDQIINIHPALLPDFGGKGMYGKHVHEAVYAFAKAHKGKKTFTNVDSSYANVNVIRSKT